ncbi:MAG: multiheme c-type cytochrome, partial [Planctomycetota bacterium]
MKLLGRTLALLLPAAVLLLLAVATRGEEEAQFAPSQLSTASGQRAAPDSFYEAADCGECHVDQYKHWNGSMHSRSHQDSIYLAFAELARREGGDALYVFCSGCHAPLAVATGEIPAGGEATFLTDEGVTCDVCHNVQKIREVHKGGGANGSIVLEEGEARYGPLADAVDTPNHKSAHSPLHAKSEFCSACHTLLHPTKGLAIENTYEEWKKSPYAEAGIQCQDCHMRTAAQAAEVARTMKPVQVAGKVTADGAERPNVHAHIFAGGNANDKVAGASDLHNAEAEARLKSAATLALKLPESAKPGATIEIEVAVTNVGAGHCIPTSITEL